MVKEVNGSGGYGMLVGPHATKQQIEEFRRKLKPAPEGFIAQPTLALSTCPTFVALGRGAAPRRPPAIRAVGRGQGPHRARRADPRGAEGGLARGQFQPGRRDQGHLGARCSSRTADNLYWVSRYVERAEFLARILDATSRLSTLPSAYGGTGTSGKRAATAGAAEAFTARYDEANERTVTDFLAFSPDNPSSIRNCFELARSNARAVRTALTGEMWEAINGAYLELRRYDPGLMTREEFARFLEWVK